MTEFRKQYQNEPVDFHLWSQDKIAEFWWKKSLEWVLNMYGANTFHGYPPINIKKEMEMELEE